MSKPTLSRKNSTISNKAQTPVYKPPAFGMEDTMAKQHSLIGMNRQKSRKLDASAKKQKGGMNLEQLFNMGELDNED